MAKNKVKRILVHVPSNFLEKFDSDISGLFASRNEAIRAGMLLVIDVEKKRRLNEKC